jgi:hypothetical protein
MTKSKITLILFVFLMTLPIVYGLNATVVYTGTNGNGANYPKLKEWDSITNAWASELELSDSGADIERLRVYYSPINLEQIIITSDSSGNLDAWICQTQDCGIDSDSWELDSNFATNVVFTGSDVRNWDGAYESVSGDFIIFYAVNSANTTCDLAYRIKEKNAVSFGSENCIDDTGVGDETVNWIWASGHSNQVNSTDDISVIYIASSQFDVTTFIWDGDNVGTLFDVVTSGVSVNNQINQIATAWDGFASKVISLTTRGSTGVGIVDWAVWNTTHWIAQSGFDVDSGEASALWQPVLKNDLISDDMQLVVTEQVSGSELHVAYYNGVSWSVTSAIDTATDGAGDMIVYGFAWNTTGNVGNLIWDTDTTGTTLSNRTCAPQCTSSTVTASTYRGSGKWIIIETNPLGDTVNAIGIRRNDTTTILGAFSITNGVLTNYGDAIITNTLSAEGGNNPSFDLAFQMSTQQIFFPITSCSNLTDNSAPYVLTSDINGVQSGRDVCIDIQTSGVTLDCDGFSITGFDNSTSIYGITNRLQASLIENITIKDCTISDYRNGIYGQRDSVIISTELTKNWKIINSTITSNDFASNSLGIFAGNGWTIHNNTITSNDIGIDYASVTFGNGIVKSDSNVTMNVINSNGIGMRLYNWSFSGNNGELRGIFNNNTISSSITTALSLQEQPITITNTIIDGTLFTGLLANKINYVGAIPVGTNTTNCWISGDKWFNMTNTSTSSWSFTNISYDDLTLSDFSNENTFRIVKWNGTAWTFDFGNYYQTQLGAIVGGTNVSANYVFGNISNFSQYEFNVFGIENYTYNYTTLTSPINEHQDYSVDINFSCAMPQVNFTIYNNTPNYSIMSTIDNERWTFDANAKATISPSQIHTYIFFWNDTINFGNITQTVEVLNLGLISGGTALCFNFLDEDTRSSLSVNTTEFIFEVINPDGSVDEESLNGTSTSSQCFSTAGLGTITLNKARLQYFKDNYATREYYLVNYTINNLTSSNISAFTLNSTIANGVVFTIQNVDGTRINDVYIKAQRFYPNLTLYDIVAMGLSDTNGQTRIYLRPNDIFYRFILEKDNEIVLTTIPLLLTADTVIFTINLNEIPLLFAFQDVAYNITFNSTTKVFSAILSDKSGGFDSYCFNVTEITALTETERCGSCLSTSSATFTCNVSDGYNENNIYTAILTGIGSLQILYSKTQEGFIWEGQSLTGSPLGNTGLFLAVMLVLASAFVGVISPPYAIIMTLVALAGSVFANLIELTIGSFIALAVAGAFIIWRLVK